MKKLNLRKTGIIIRNNYITNRSLPLILFAVVLAIGCIIGAMPISGVETDYAHSYAMTYNTYENYVYNMTRTYDDLIGFEGVFSYFFIFVAITLPLLSALSLNGFMRDKSGNDFYHSLSVTRNEIFLANYITALINSAVTVIVSQLSGIFLMNMIANYKPLSLGELLLEQLPVVGTLLLFIALFTAIAMISVTAAGTVFAGIVNYTFINFYIPATILAVAISGLQLFSTNLESYLGHFPHVFAYTSPLIRYIFGCMDDNSIAFTPLTYILLAVVTILLVIAGMWLYSVKKNENSFKPLPFTQMTRPMQYLLTFDAILLGGTFFEAITSSAIWLVVGVLLALFFSFIAFNAFANKSFNGVFKNARHMAFILIMTLIIGAVFVADIFHIYKEPLLNPDKIVSAYLHASYRYTDRDQYYNYDFVEELDEGYKYGTEVNEEIREDLARLYKLAVEHDEQYRNDYYSDESISVSFGIGCKNDFQRYHYYTDIEKGSKQWEEVKAILDKFAEKYYKYESEIYYHEAVTVEQIQ